VNAIDFGNSCFIALGKGNNVRIHLESACTVVDERSRKSRAYYLIAPCRAENTHADSNLVRVPGYEWGGWLNEEEHVTIRKHLLSEPDYPITPGSLKQYGPSENARIELRRYTESRSVSDISEIIEMSLGTTPIVSRTELRDEARKLRFILEYPVRTMNILNETPRFQVDTGPLIVPDFESTAERQIERFDIAFVVYNRFDQAEFALRRPAPVHKGNKPLFSVTDYSEVKILPAANELLFATKM